MTQLDGTQLLFDTTEEWDASNDTGAIGCFIENTKACTVVATGNPMQDRELIVHSKEHFVLAMKELLKLQENKLLEKTTLELAIKDDGVKLIYIVDGDIAGYLFSNEFIIQDGWAVATFMTEITSLLQWRNA